MEKLMRREQAVEAEELTNLSITTEEDAAPRRCIEHHTVATARSFIETREDFGLELWRSFTAYFDSITVRENIGDMGNLLNTKPAKVWLQLRVMISDFEAELEEFEKVTPSTDHFGDLVTRGLIWNMVPVKEKDVPPNQRVLEDGAGIQAEAHEDRGGQAPWAADAGEQHRAGRGHVPGLVERGDAACGDILVRQCLGELVNTKGKIEEAAMGQERERRRQWGKRRW